MMNQRLETEIMGMTAINLSTSVIQINLKLSVSQFFRKKLKINGSENFLLH